MVIQYVEILVIWEVELNHSIEYGSKLYFKKLERLRKLTEWEDHHRNKCNQVKWSFN